MGLTKTKKIEHMGLVGEKYEEKMGLLNNGPA
jgi:hypothetical protein